MAETDRRQRVMGQLLRTVNPLVRWMVRVGLPTGAPNILLTVPGRRTGTPRTVPVGVVELEGRRFIQATYSEHGWIRNLRAAGAATITERDHRESVAAVELTPGDAALILRRALGPLHRSRVLRALLGPRFRPPLAILLRLRMRVDDTFEEYVADAQRHPLFELRPITPR